MWHTRPHAQACPDVFAPLLSFYSQFLLLFSFFFPSNMSVILHHLSPFVIDFWLTFCCDGGLLSRTGPTKKSTNNYTSTDQEFDDRARGRGNGGGRGGRGDRAGGRGSGRGNRKDDRKSKNGYVTLHKPNHALYCLLEANKKRNTR